MSHLQLKVANKLKKSFNSFKIYTSLNSMKKNIYNLIFNLFAWLSKFRLGKIELPAGPPQVGLLLNLSNMGYKTCAFILPSIAVTAVTKNGNNY